MVAEKSGQLTVHVLDTACGKPAAGMTLSLFRIDGDTRTLVLTRRTNSDGRCDSPLLYGDALRAGCYEVMFDVAAWRIANGEAEAGFFDVIPIRFRVADTSEHYHVPLLLSPFGYTTYRGS